MYYDNENYIIDTIKGLLFQENENIFDLINFENDEIYLEPLLFAYFNNPDANFTLMQVLYGYVNIDKRPQIIDVFSNELDVIYLPNFSYIKTKKSNCKLQIETTREGISVLNIDTPIDFILEAIKFVSGIEILSHSNPLISCCCLDIEGHIIKNLEIEKTVKKNITELEKAIKFIAQFNQTMYNKIKQSSLVLLSLGWRRDELPFY